ncbi:uncharacterized protein [Hyperolius riggenbachi]|uniref:uncharacterized protein n=1 Tax=Hyperolius riggenbachi TaxID=752182 RepID=UPI0035A2E610
MSNIPPALSPQQDQVAVSKQQVDGASNETTKPEVSKTSDICLKTHDGGQRLGSSMMEDRELKSPRIHFWNFIKRFHMKKNIKHFIPGHNTPSPDKRQVPNDVLLVGNDSTKNERKFEKLARSPNRTVDEEKRSVPFLHEPCPPELMRSKEGNTEKTLNTLHSLDTYFSQLSSKTQDGTSVEPKEGSIHLKTLPQKTLNIPTAGGDNTNKNEDGETIIAIKQPAVVVENAKAKTNLVPFKRASGIQNIKLNKKLKEGLSCSSLPLYAIQSINLASEHDEAISSNTHVLKQSISEDHSNIQPLTVQWSQSKQECVPLRPVLSSNQEIANVQNNMMKTTNLLLPGWAEEIFIESSGTKVKERAIKTSPQKQNIKSTNNDNNRLSTNLTFKMRKLTFVWPSPEKSPNNQFQFNRAGKEDESNEDFTPKSACDLQIVPKESFKSSSLSEGQNLSTGKPQDQARSPGNTNLKVNSWAISAPNQVNPLQTRSVTMLSSLRDPEEVVDTSEVFLPKESHTECELPEENLSESNLLDQEQVTTNTIDSGNSKIQEMQPEPLKDFQPAQIEDLDIPQHGVAEEKMSSHPHSSSQTQLKITQTLDPTNLELPGSMGGNGLPDVQVSSSVIQDGNFKQEKDEDGLVEEQPSRRWEDFVVDRACTRKCRCKHLQRNLPPNVTSWLSVSENKLCEPVWITTLMLASSIVAASKLVLDSCSQWDSTDRPDGGPKDNDAQD